MIPNEAYFIFSSSMVFMILNLLENFIHYNIGRSHDKNKVEYKLPSSEDLVKIILVMIIFALLQAFLTYYVNT